MARPTRTNAEYFYHPASFRNDRRVKAIRARFGACGYGLLLMLIELLTDADNTSLATDEMEVELLAGDLSSTVDDVTNLIQAAEKVGLFGRNEAGLLKCPQLDEWLAPVFEKRNRSRNTPTAPKLSQPVTETGVSVTEIPPVKESTVEYSTEQESKEVLTSSSLRSEPAANAAAPAQKKIEGAEELQLESPAPPQTKPPVAKPPRLVELRFPEWATSNFREEWDKWVAYRQKKRDKLKPESLQKMLDKLGQFDEAYCLQLFDKAITNGYTGLVFDDTAQKFACYLQSQQPGYVHGNQHPASNGVAGHGFHRPAAVHSNPFGIASPQSLAIARAVVVGSADGNYGLEL